MGLPREFKYPGRLYLKGGLALLPEGLEVLEIRREFSAFSLLSSIQPRLRVRGDASFSDAIHLKQLAPGIRIDGDLDLSGCHRLECLPPDLEVRGRLDLSGCDALKEIPSTIRAGSILPPLGLAGRDWIGMAYDAAFDPMPFLTRTDPPDGDAHLCLALPEGPILMLDTDPSTFWEKVQRCACCFDYYNGTAMKVVLTPEQTRTLNGWLDNPRFVRHLRRILRLNSENCIHDIVFLDHPDNKAGRVKVLVRIANPNGPFTHGPPTYTTRQGWFLWDHPYGSYGERAE